MWSDKSAFTLAYEGRIRVWFTPEEMNTPVTTKDTVKHDFKKSMFGMHFQQQQVLVICIKIKGIMNQHQYYNIQRILLLTCLGKNTKIGYGCVHFLPHTVGYKKRETYIEIDS